MKKVEKKHWLLQYLLVKWKHWFKLLAFTGKYSENIADKKIQNFQKNVDNKKHICYIRKRCLRKAKTTKKIKLKNEKKLLTFNDISDIVLNVAWKKSNKKIYQKNKKNCWLSKENLIYYLCTRKSADDLWKLSKTSITLSQEILNVIKLKKINFLESLILAQDERWRHA